MIKERVERLAQKFRLFSYRYLSYWLKLSRSSLCDTSLSWHHVIPEIQRGCGRTVMRSWKGFMIAVISLHLNDQSLV